MSKIQAKTTVIINPKSSNGATGKNIDYIKNIIQKLDNPEIIITKSKNEATDITQKAILNGTEKIIAVGGDGTINEIINGFFLEEKIINPNVIFGILPCGTGSDFVRTLHLPKNNNKVIEKILENKTKLIDVGKANYSDLNHQAKTRFFINASNIGIGGEVVDRVNQTSKIFGGFASFLAGTILSVMDYKNKKVSITFDHEQKIEFTTINIVVANGQFCGGGMKFLPDSSLDDGLFDILLIGDLSKADFFRLIPKVYSGLHLRDPKINVKKAKNVLIESEYKLKLDFDGEWDGYTSASYDVVRNTIRIII